MRLFLLISLAAASVFAGDIAGTPLVDKEAGLDAIVITIPPEQNRGFVVVDVSSKIDGDNLRRHWQDDYAFMINGGYFNPDFSPTGFCRIDGQVINKTVARKLSGFVALDRKGSLSLLTRNDDLSPYPTVIQNGPYVIDPGGGIGIHSNDGVRAERTLIGETNDHRLLILVIKPITLYDLAAAIKKAMPEIERLLNLDGGPSTALKTPKNEILNRLPVRNYIAQKKPAGAVTP
jgi:hypothetical protein